MSKTPQPLAPTEKTLDLLSEVDIEFDGSVLSWVIEIPATVSIEVKARTAEEAAELANAEISGLSLSSAGCAVHPDSDASLSIVEIEGRYCSGVI